MRLKYLVPGVLAGINGPKPFEMFETINDTLPEGELVVLVNYRLILNNI